MNSSLRPRMSAPSSTDANRTAHPSRRFTSALTRDVNDGATIRASMRLQFICADLCCNDPDRFSSSNFLRSHNQMNDAIRRGDEEAVEIFAQLLDFVAARDAVNF